VPPPHSEEFRGFQRLDQLQPMSRPIFRRPFRSQAPGIQSIKEWEDHKNGTSCPISEPGSDGTDGYAQQCDASESGKLIKMEDYLPFLKTTTQ
jgi:hypothetical protein